MASKSLWSHYEPRQKGSLMKPKGPPGQWRPADAVGCAVHVMKIATGEIEETYEKPKPAAKVRAGKRSGPARAKALRQNGTPRSQRPPPQRGGRRPKTNSASSPARFQNRSLPGRAPGRATTQAGEKTRLFAWARVMTPSPGR